jgi:hypothetical protein
MSRGAPVMRSNGSKVGRSFVHTPAGAMFTAATRAAPWEDPLLHSATGDLPREGRSLHADGRDRTGVDRRMTRASRVLLGEDRPLHRPSRSHEPPGEPSLLRARSSPRRSQAVAGVEELCRLGHLADRRLGDAVCKTAVHPGPERHHQREGVATDPHLAPPGKRSRNAWRGMPHHFQSHRRAGAAGRIQEALA